MMIPKKLLIVVVAVVLIVPMLFVTGLIPLSIAVNDVTENSTHGGICGSGELIGPNARKGFIMSWKTDGHSEFITVTGKACIDLWATGGINAYRYMVYGKTATSIDWEPLSVPGDTKKFISNPNPGTIGFSGLQVGGCDNADSYSFTLIGSEYRAIRVVFQGRIDWNLLNPFDDGWKWRTLQSDEAVMYEGHGGLYLPRGIDEDRPYSTFEIGQEVKIRVETTKGGATVGEADSWKVTLNEPYGGNIDAPDTGGSVVKTETYGDDHVGYFTFTVTEDMAAKSMNSDYPYSIRIWNTILPVGTLDVDFLDFIAKAPGDVRVYIDGNELAPGMQTKVGDTASVEIRADVNEETGLAIEYFRVSIIYGTNNILLPSEWSSHLWILHTTNVPAIKSGSDYTATISYTPEKESYVSIHIKAFDTAGRGSPSGMIFTSWSYADNPVPDEVIEDETGTDYYGGGRTSDWLPWDPGGGNWEAAPGIIINWIGVLVAAIIIGMFVVAGLKMPGRKENKIIVAVIGMIVAVVVYAYYFTSIFGG